jgi:hypothetical protein
MRAADPWRDTDVIDERAPRFNQAVTGTVAVIGAILGWPLAWALMAAQLLIGLTLGRRLCIPCVAYFVIVQPRFGEGALEDSRPPRLANKMGVAFLGGAAAAWWLGAPAVGTALGLLVAALALLAAATGFCAGCEVYRLTARLRGISPRHHGRRSRRHRRPAGLCRVHSSALHGVPRVGAASGDRARAAPQARRQRPPGSGTEVRGRSRSHRAQGGARRGCAGAPGAIAAACGRDLMAKPASGIVARTPAESRP